MPAEGIRGNIVLTDQIGGRYQKVSRISIVSYQSGNEKKWAKLGYAIRDFGFVTEAEQYLSRRIGRTI